MGQLERILKEFKNHKATLQDLGEIKILDFKKTKSETWHIRYLFDESQYTLHISGTAGSLVAKNYSNMTLDKFHEFTSSDVYYFIEKVVCHSKPFEYYDIDKMIERIEEIANDNACVKARIKERYETMHSLQAYIAEYVDEKGLDEYWRDELEEVYINPDEIEEVSLVKTAYPEIYLRAFEMAVKQLKKG